MITDAPTPCFQKGSLFDSILEADHVIARELCLGCPMLAECIAERAATIEQHGVLSLEGTWAGDLYTGKKQRARGACGTRAGYNSHRYRQERACGPCRRAEADAAAARKAAKLAEAEESAA